jgi:2-polyprenyl-6-methoxyphenol hydroxylase-like FAD-dependent oxidoreductase
MGSNSETVIIGAGVIGLTLGNLLLDSKKYQKVTILAEHIGSSDHPEYTSSKAGANWSSVAEDKIHQGNQLKYFYIKII